MRAALTCECDVPGCDGAPMAHLCEDHMPRLPAPDVQALRGQIESEVWEARKRVEAALSAEIVELRAQIDAARAEEREKMWLACSEVVIKAHQKHGYNDATGLIIAINNDLSALFDDVIRARSGARGA